MSAPPVSPFPAFGGGNPNEGAAASNQSRRRAELQKLKDQQAKGSTEALLNRASQSTSMNGRIPPPKRQGPRRTSDVFPTAPKSVPSAPTGQPPVARRLDVSFVSKKPGVAPPPRASKIPPPQRPKSAPPRRPPGPPPSSKSPARSNSVANNRGTVTRPEPVLPGETTPPMGNRSSVRMKAGDTVIPTPMNGANRYSPRTEKPLSSGPPMVTPAAPKGDVSTPPSLLSESNMYAGATPYHNNNHGGLTANAGVTPFPAKQNGSLTSNAGATPHPTKQNGSLTSNAGVTPHPTKQNGSLTANAGATPFPKAENATPPYSKMVVATNGVMSPLADDSGAVTTSESPELRMQKQLRDAQHEKTVAFGRIARLEDELKEKQSGDDGEILQTLLQVANTQGSEAAMTLLRQKMEGLPIELPKNKNNTRVTVASPTPKQKAPNNNDLGPFCKSAVETLPFEYESNGMSVKIRRPHGVGSASEQKFWFDGGELNAKQYAQQASAQSPATVEVLAIWPDETALLLYGESTVRHRSNGGRWVPVGPVGDGVDLGEVTVEQPDGPPATHYWDEAFQNAMAAREHYCQAAVATADALRVQAEKAGPPAAAPAKPAPEKKKSKPSTPPPPEETSPGISFSGIILFLLSPLFLVVRILYSGVVWALIHLTAVFLLSAFYLYVAADRGAGPMSAATEMLHNRAGIS